MTAAVGNGDAALLPQDFEYVLVPAQHHPKA
jgi:hypothetical protein